jgi:hypothetical protein
MKEDIKAGKVICGVLSPALARSDRSFVLAE